MGGPGAEDERDGVSVGVDEADAPRGERFAGAQVGGVGTRTAARAGDDAAPAGDAADASPTADMTDSQMLGHRLFLARQRAGLSVEDVTACTRIRPGMVR